MQANVFSNGGVNPGAQPANEDKTFRVEWQKRGGRVAEDWVIRLGITVADAHGRVLPVHSYLRQVITEFVEALSTPAYGRIQHEWDTREVLELVKRTVREATSVVTNPVEFPDNYASWCALAMLWGNFTDALLVVLDAASDEDPPLICIDATTLTVILPLGYIRCRARITGAEPARECYAVVLEPTSPATASGKWWIEGTMPANLVWGLMNALGVSFPGGAGQGKAAMQAYCRTLAGTFLKKLSSEGVSTSDFLTYSGQNVG